MRSMGWEDLVVIPEKQGAKEFLKVSYPIRYGCYGEIRTREHVFRFNRNGEIKFIEARFLGGFDGVGWLKRTLGNDWTFYSPGDYGSVFDLYGEYYLPFLSYPSNSLIGRSALEERATRRALEAWRNLREEIPRSIRRGVEKEVAQFLSSVAAGDDRKLQNRADELHRLIGGPLSVLPPDSRHVDYEVIPLIIADGCTYRCGFCRVKSERGFSVRSIKEIEKEIEGLKGFLGRDLPNYNAVFLGNHDALNVDGGLLVSVAEKAYDLFELDRSYMKGAYLFLFGSVGSFLRSKEGLFEALNRLPFFTYLNLGFESMDPETLTLIGKPVSAEEVREAFARMLEVNRIYERIEVTANFVVGENLPPTHLLSLVETLGMRIRTRPAKGCLYLSPLVDGPIEGVRRRREFLRQFQKVKNASFLPAYLYLIQRL